MKKLSTLFIMLILALALSACGNNANDNNLMGGGESQQNGNSETSSLNPSTSSNQNLQQGNQTSDITRERALEIALEKAGVKESDIRDLDIELDDERGEKVWEIDFDHENLEYSYDINAETGAITKVERERDN